MSGERRHAAPVPGVLVSVLFAAFLILDGYEDLPCAGVWIADSGVVHFPAAGPLARHDNFAAVPAEPPAVLSPLPLPLAERRHVVPVPAVWALVCSAARVFPHGCEKRLCVGAGLADSGAARFPMPAQLGQDVPAAILA